MKRTETALLRAIVESPDDDLPRLAYADWLEEQGNDDRAEFIRVQLRLARMAATAPEREEGQRRERELLETHADEWLKPFRKWLHEPADILIPHRPRWEFRRGFLERATLTVEGFGKDGKKLLDAAPVREAWFPDCEGEDLADLGEIETLRRLTALDLAGANYTDGTDELLYSEHLRGLRRLDFFCEVHDEGMGGDVWYPLLTSESLANLQELLLSEQPMDEDVFDYVLRNFKLPSLRKLGLEGVVGIDRDIAQKIAKAKSLRRIEVLAVTCKYLETGAETALRRRFGDGLLINDLDTQDGGWKACF
jgi:uncharacterized protein (TIGR02996 family)